MNLIQNCEFILLSLTPETKTMSVSFFNAVVAFNISRQAEMSASVSIDFFTSMPLQERAKQLALAVRDELQMTITWLKGRYLEMLRVSRPISVQASMTGECRLKAERTTQLATASDLVIGFCEFYNMSRKNSQYGKCYSAEMHMSFIVTRESNGYLPTEHSALRSSPSAPSITAACISLTSARSGNGLKTMLSKN